MSIALYLKNNLRNFHPRIGCVINKLPFTHRPGLGSIYRRRLKEISAFEKYSPEEKQQFIYERIKKIVDYAYENIYAYQDIYNRAGFKPGDLKQFDDINKIPVVDKKILNKYSLEERSSSIKSKYVVNTGGSSGTPFFFNIEPSSMGHEWAHMHSVWGEFNYKPSDLKLAFGGRSDVKDLVDYDVVRNTFAVDIYSDYKKVADKLRRVLKKYRIKYLHGYPSSIYDFAVYCSNHDTELQQILSRNLKGAFLGSEYPHKYYRKAIEETLNIPTISFYGHTERCILAYEKREKFVFEPFQTYGYAEGINQDGLIELTGTSYYNFASPLIRYNTNDVITELNIENEILTSFKIKEGRSGEFVIDKNGKKINLTGLIFGRHHEIFNYSKFVQVRQHEPGQIQILFVSGSLSEEEASQLFDKTNIDMDITFIKRDEPERTISGKVHLLVK